MIWIGDRLWEVISRLREVVTHGGLTVLFHLDDLIWATRIVLVSGICNSVVGFVNFCTRHGSIRKCDFGSLRVSLPAVFVSSRNALSKNGCGGDYCERNKSINLGFAKPSSSLREEL